MRRAPALPRFALALAGLLAVAGGAAHAAHPSLTEDTGTQGAGHVEVEFGSSIERLPGSRVTTLDPQVSIGVTDRVDAIVRPTVVWLGGGDDSTRGLAATTSDVKWRFLERDGLNVGLRAGVDWPTGSERLGGDRASVHGVLVVTRSIGDGTASLNFGVARHADAMGERRRVLQIAAGVVYPIAAALTFVADLAVQSNDDAQRATTPAVASVGVIARITPWLDVDVGWRTALNDVARPHALLAGATLRW
jgi:outer membrane putative beta-barrel porin/alpha-amylase